MANINIVAMLIEQGGRLASEMIRIRPRHQKVEVPHDSQPSPPPEPAPAAQAESTSQIEVLTAQAEARKSNFKATAVATGCLPCSLGHVGTCSGLLNEAMRFARKDGIGEEVIDRVGMCLDELNTMERVDLRPQMIEDLPKWEKDIALEVLKESRTLRHGLESIKSADDLEHLAAQTQTARQELGRKYFSAKMDTMSEISPEMKVKVLAKLDEGNAGDD